MPIERLRHNVARAIYEAQGGAPDRFDHEWNHSEVFREEWGRVAQAVIAEVAREIGLDDPAE